MIKILYNYIYIIFSILFLVRNGNSLEIYIGNEDEEFYNLSDVLFDSLYEDELIVNFVDSYYDMTYVFMDIMLPIDIDITFRGNENGTVFDYKNEVFWGGFYYFLELGKTFKIENIIFQNFSNKSNDNEVVPLLEIYATFNNFSVIFNNCSFKSNYNVAILVDLIEPCDYFNDCEEKYNHLFI